MSREYNVLSGHICLINLLIIDLYNIDIGYDNRVLSELVVYTLFSDYLFYINFFIIDSIYIKLVLI